MYTATQAREVERGNRIRSRAVQERSIHSWAALAGCRPEVVPAEAGRGVPAVAVAAVRLGP